MRSDLAQLRRGYRCWFWWWTWNRHFNRFVGGKLPIRNPRVNKLYYSQGLERAPKSAKYEERLTWWDTRG